MKKQRKANLKYKIVAKYNNFFNSGHERTLLAKKNIQISFLVKGLSIVLGLVLIPMTIKYVNPTQYGIWLTLSSIINWFSFFDVGLGNGLKNKLAEARAIGEFKTARVMVSTTYAVLIIIASLIFVFFYIGNNFISWNRIFNIANNANIVNLSNLALVVVFLFCFQFVVQILNVVLTANHAPAKVSVINLIGQIISFGVIYVLTKTTEGSLSYLVLVLAGIPVLVLFLCSIWYYNRDYSFLAPSINLVELRYANELLKLGGVFFFLQIGALVLFQTDNIVITQLFGPKYVTTFNIAYKLFSSIIQVFTIIITPFWSAFTDAYAKGDIDWIRTVLTKMRKYWLYISFVTVIILCVSPLIYRIWLKGAILVPFSLSVAMAFYVIVYIWQTLHVFLLNGIGKVRLQLYLVICAAIINIPLAIFLGKWIGLPGVTIANAVTFLVLGFIFFVQCNKVLNGSASKIWNK